jgi:hypothetical protein
MREVNVFRDIVGTIETTKRMLKSIGNEKRITLQSCEKLLPKSGKLGPSWQRNNDILSLVVGPIVMCSAKNGCRIANESFD